MNQAFRNKPLALLAAAILGASAPAWAADDVPARVKALNDLLGEQWEYALKEAPEFATIIGDYRYNDKLSDISPEHQLQQQKDAEAFLKRFQAIDTSGFTEQDRLNQELMVQQLKDNLRGDELKNYEMPLDQFNGVHLQMAQFVSAIPFDSTRHYEDYLARLHLMSKAVDQAIALARNGEKDGLMPPKYLLE
ncbi:MAG TPA: DUF885 family protein, partial [Nevskia sp.]|nr:DUF885 family protein [Nevskia sp.]